MTAPHVAIVGGGLAGLSAAVACADAGARVTLFEARPRLGGATWSTRHQGLDVDNGQHVFLRCCTAYRNFLRRIGADSRVHLQERLAVPVIAPGKSPAWVRRSRLPRPAHLAPSLLRFSRLPFAARVHAARTARRLGALDLADPTIDAQSLGAWLAAQGESDAAIDTFWDLLVRPTINLPAREASLALAAKVFQTGLLGESDAADIGWATAPLEAVHAEPALRVLEKAGAIVHRRATVTRLDAPAGERPRLFVAGERVAADAVIVAVPHDAAAALLPPVCGVDAAALRALGTSPIVNLHVHFERRVTEHALLAAIDSPLQWIFDRTRAAGVERGQYLAVSLSAADAWLGRSRAELRAVFLPALAALLPASRGVPVLRFFTTIERAATFRGVAGTARLRPGARTAAPRVALAGAWTDTGWPATMEGAVRSGLAAARIALLAAGFAERLPAEAA